jgi:hypothetical protein
MSSRNPALSPSVAAQPRTRTEKSAGGGAAGVEIVGFPQTLFTRTFGDPDTLFVPLLDAAREAYRMSERFSTHGETKANSLMLSGMQLASSLLRDSSFSLVAKGVSHENFYIVDLAAGTLHVSTRLYAVVSRRTSFFKVEIAGNISGGPFVARNPANGEVIMQIEEQRLREPGFFSELLPRDCLRVQIEQERLGHLEKSLGAEERGEVRLMVTVAGERAPVTLRQKETGGTWEVIDGRRQESVGTLSADMEEHLKAVTSFVQELFARR